MSNTLYRFVKASEPPKARMKNVIVQCENKAGNVWNNVANYDPEKIYAGSNWDVDNVTHYLAKVEADQQEAICSHCGDPIEHPLCRQCEIQLTLPTDEY